MRFRVRWPGIVHALWADYWTPVVPEGWPFYFIFYISRFFFFLYTYYVRITVHYVPVHPRDGLYIYNIVFVYAHSYNIKITDVHKWILFRIASSSTAINSNNNILRRRKYYYFLALYTYACILTFFYLQILNCSFVYLRTICSVRKNTSNERILFTDV